MAKKEMGDDVGGFKPFWAKKKEKEKEEKDGKKPFGKKGLFNKKKKHKMVEDKDDDGE